MTGSLITLLLKPDVFFRDLMTERESVGIPALFVITNGLIAAVGAYLMAGVTGRLLSAVLPGMGSLMEILGAVFAVVGVIVFWILIAGIFHLLSSVFKGQGSFNRTLEVVGYGFLPQVIGAIAATLFAIIYLPEISVPVLSASAIEDPQAIQAATAALMHEPAMILYQQSVALVSMILLIWSAFIWISGIRAARGISHRDAVLCVGVPVALYILYLVYSVTIVVG